MSEPGSRRSCGSLSHSNPIHIDHREPATAPLAKTPRRWSMYFVTLVFLLVFPAMSAFAQNEYFLPHVADGKYAGGSFRTTFILFDNSSTDTTALLELTDNEGNPLVVTIPGLGTDSRFTIQLAAGATRILQTNGAGNLATGAATVTSLAKIGVSSIFTLYDPAGNYLSEAGVGSSLPLTEFVLPVDTTGVFNTGLALFNAGTADAVITLILRGTNGAEAARLQFTLAAGKHLARFVKGANEFFPVIGSFQGTLLVQCTAPVSVLVLRQHESPLSYTSLPAVATSSTGTTLNLAHWANGVFNAGSFRTSFLIFNISSAAANITIALTAPTTISGLGSGTSFTLPPLAPGASLFLQTDGTGALVSGAAAITSNVPIGASGIFTVLNTSGAFTTEAGVGDSAVFTTLTLPVQIIDGLDTGVAFFRPGNNGHNPDFSSAGSGRVSGRNERPAAPGGKRPVARVYLADLSRNHRFLRIGSHQRHSRRLSHDAAPERRATVLHHIADRIGNRSRQGTGRAAAFKNRDRHRCAGQQPECGVEPGAAGRIQAFRRRRRNGNSDPGKRQRRRYQRLYGSGRSVDRPIPDRCSCRDLFPQGPATSRPALPSAVIATYDDPAARVASLEIPLAM